MRGLSSLVVGLLLALAVAGALVAVIRWARQRGESLESLNGNLKPSYPTVSTHGLSGRTVVANSDKVLDVITKKVLKVYPKENSANHSGVAGAF